MDINIFLEVVHKKFKDEFCRNICRDIERLLLKKGKTYSKSDLEQDCIIYFLEKDRYNKIKNENGARISIERYLKWIYRKIKTRRYSDEYYLEYQFMKSMEMNLLVNDLEYNKDQLKLHALIFHNIKPRRPKASAYFRIDTRPTVRIRLLLTLLAKICSIDKNKTLCELFNYFIIRDRKSNIDSIFYVKYVNIHKNELLRVSPQKVFLYLKESYIKEVNKIFEKNKLQCLCKTDKSHKR